MEFTHAELMEIWTALQQYADNHEPTDDDTSMVPEAAQTALGKLDLYVEKMVP